MRKGRCLRYVLEIAGWRCRNALGLCFFPADSDSYDPHPLIKRPACRPVKHQRWDHGNYKGGLPRLHGMDALASPLNWGQGALRGAAGTGSAK
jgi:hypothetical protein